MNHKLFLDTNILLDFCVPGRPEPEGSVCLLTDIEFQAVDAVINSGQLKDMYYILDGSGSEIAARSNVAGALSSLDVIPLTPEICKQALACDEPDFEDGLIRICAEQEGVDYIISRDKEAYRNSKIKRLSAQEYIERSKEWHKIDFSLQF